MKQLVITTTSWKALIESLKGNAKHGYNKLESLKQADGYFTAVLCQNTDASYLERLKIVTGHSETGDEEDVEYALEFLSLKEKSVTLRPTPSGEEIKAIFDPFVEPKESVGVKIKRTPRKPKESK